MKVTKSQLRQLISETVEDSSRQMSIDRLGEQITRLEDAAARIEQEIPFDFGDTKSDRAAREAGNVIKDVASRLRRDLKSLGISIDDAMVDPGHAAEPKSVASVAAELPKTTRRPGWQNRPGGFSEDIPGLDESKLRAMIKDVLTSTAEK